MVQGKNAAKCSLMLIQKILHCKTIETEDCFVIAVKVLFSIMSQQNSFSVIPSEKTQLAKSGLSEDNAIIAIDLCLEIHSLILQGTAIHRKASSLLFFLIDWAKSLNINLIELL